MKTKLLPPYAPSLIESTRAIGYSLEAAIADIVDNSITANANTVEIFFFPINEAYVAILDNGNGMKGDELDRAMQYGSRNPWDPRDAKDLGRFGLGLKTASLSQCRCLSVISKQGSVIQGRRWDIDHIIQEGQWSLLVLEKKEISEIPRIEKLMEIETGTLVVWQKLDRLKIGEINFEQSFGRKFDRVRDHISLVYHRYLSGTENDIKKITISINNEEVRPFDPFLKNKSDRPMDDEIMEIHGKKIIVRPYLLPHISRMSSEELKQLGGEEGLRKKQGFYIYRNKRLLVAGTWFRMMRQSDLSKLARIQVDIPNSLDDIWTLDIKKSSVLPSSQFRKNFEAIIDRIAEKSKRKWTFRGKKEITETKLHIWNRMKHSCGGFYYEINRDHPLIKQIVTFDRNLEKPLCSLLNQIEKGLPLNQLYVDMNNDEQLQNGLPQDRVDIAKTLRTMVELGRTPQEKIAFLDAVSNIEPFSTYHIAIEEVKKEIES